MFKSPSFGSLWTSPFCSSFTAIFPSTTVLKVKAKREREPINIKLRNRKTVSSFIQ